MYTPKDHAGTPIQYVKPSNVVSDDDISKTAMDAFESHSRI